ncbi:hypothetical protein L1987_55355 [Smallanthus sonchifolius]|uniref:Uncharacterized protein n=1 Tax=Smallanthus sonchifolius TaxID=185202 RepID=A0ACB9E9P8_9ASTR|nr:hypothetical protein L1987_55355 [Smallanthus sonchifolius]
MEDINGKKKRKMMEEADLKSFSTNSDLRFEDVVGSACLDNLTRREFVVRLRDVMESHHVYDMEVRSDAWMGIEFLEIPRLMKRIKIFGIRAQIYRALIMVHKVALEPYIPVETDDKKYAKLEEQHNEVYVPSGQVVSDSLLGASFNKVKEMEAHSGAQIEVDPLVDLGEGHLRMIRLKIFGSRAQIYQVLTMVHKAVLEPYILEDQESIKLEDENKQHHDSHHVKEAKDTTEVYDASTTECYKKFVYKPKSYSDWLKLEPQLAKFRSLQHEIPEDQESAKLKDENKQHHASSTAYWKLAFELFE